MFRSRTTSSADPTGRGQVLVIDDDDLLARLLCAQLASRGYEVSRAASAEEGLLAIDRAPPDAVVLDHGLPGISGLAVLSTLHEQGNSLAVIMLSGSIDVPTTVAALRAGAEDVLLKPANLEHLTLAIDRGIARARLVRSHRLQRTQVADPYGVLDDSPLMQRLLRSAEGLSRSLLPLLIIGEAGTGKRVVADLLHHLSPAASGPFVSVACTGHAGDELCDLLLGAGGEGSGAGILASAAGGTLFLDDIGVLGERTQALLLQVIDDRPTEGRANGGPHAATPRVIIATRRDLSSDARQGVMRMDLYQRIAVVPIVVPSLRHRGTGAVTALARRLVRTQRAELGEGPLDLAESAAALLASQEWPGNVPQLRAVLDDAFARALDAPQIAVEHVRPALERFLGAPVAGDEGEDLSLRAVERQHIARVLAQVAGHRTRAAQLLGITRTTLYKKIEEYGLAPRDDA